MSQHLLAAALLVASTTAVFAQSTPAPVSTSPSGQPTITPKNGQSQDQLGRDRYECHHWAVQQTGFDPSLGTSQGNPSAPSAYQRALSACLEGRGYDVHLSAPAQPTPSPYPAAPARATTSYVYDTGPELKYRPLQFAVEGGFIAPAGRTDDHWQDGATGGLGLIWYPAPALPLALRADASYSRLDARHDRHEEDGYTRGHENVYGGDIDLQVDVLKSSRNKLYVFGGAGEYQEQIRRYETTFTGGIGCPYFGCGGPGETTADRRTTGWRLSYNAGAGWETALPNHASLFVEARFQRIAPGAEYVPVRVGLRF